MAEIIPSFDTTQAQRIEAPDTTEIKQSLEKEIKGQDEAVEAWAGILQRVLADAPKLRKGPLAVLTEIGPSGVGKTEIAIQAARYLASHSKKSQSLGVESEKPSVLRIDCGEYQQEHEVSKVIGSPPGYVGGDTTPRLAQSEIDKYAIQLDEEHKVTILLLDEIEKANPKLNVTFLGGLDYGVITLGNNQKASLENCIVVFTSNLGNKEISNAEAEGGGLETDEKRKMRLDAMREHFSPEQLSRMGGETNTVCFNELSREVVGDILVSKLNKLEQAYMKHGRNISFQITQGGLENLLNLGYSAQEGARRLETVLEQQITSRLTTLEKAKAKTPVVIDAENGGIALYAPNPPISEEKKNDKETDVRTAQSTKESQPPEKQTEREDAEKIEVQEGEDPREIFQGYNSLVKRLSDIGATYKEADRKKRYPNDTTRHYPEREVRELGEKGNLNYHVQRAFKEAVEAGTSPISEVAAQEALRSYFNKMGLMLIEKIKADNARTDYKKKQDIEGVNYKFGQAVNSGSPDRLVEEFKREILGVRGF